MRLADPTDFQILEALSDGRRNTAANLSYVLDKDRSYINTRLPILADYELVDRVGPAPNSGLYEITERGRAVIEIRESASEQDVDFEARLSKRFEA
jgi:predicted transcriptional regulator